MQFQTIKTRHGDIVIINVLTIWHDN